MKVEILENDVVWREIDGEVVLLNLATGHYYGLEGAANQMWQLLVEHGSTETVVQIMSAEYDVDPEQLAHDVDTLVQGLADKSIVQLG